MAAASDRAVSRTRRAASGSKRPGSSRRAPPDPSRRAARSTRRAHADSSRRAAETNGHDHRALIDQVEALRRGQPAEALAVLERGFESALAAGTPSGRGELWRLRGHVLRSLRRAREAATAYRRAARWYEQAGD